MESGSNLGCKNASSICIKECSKTPFMNSDADLLEEPYAQAVLQMGYCGKDILQAVKTLQRRHQPFAAREVLQELMVMESEGRAGISEAPPSASASSSRKRTASSGKQQRKMYGSDGEEIQEDFDSLEEDGARGGDLALIEDELKDTAAVEARGPLQKKPTIDHEGRMEKDVLDMRRRLLALREENRRLKTRHLCRKCGQQPVSLTFLPCGHFSFCFQCGQSFQACPICHKPILADVKTFLG